MHPVNILLSSTNTHSYYCDLVCDASRAFSRCMSGTIRYVVQFAIVMRDETLQQVGTAPQRKDAERSGELHISSPFTHPDQLRCLVFSNHEDVALYLPSVVCVSFRHKPGHSICNQSPFGHNNSEMIVSLSCRLSQRSSCEGMNE